MSNWRNTAAIVGCLGALLAPLTAQAQEYPEGQIRFLLHVEPGGATDVMGRRLAAGLQQQLGNTVVVENRSGGSGARQMAQLARAEPDGLTIGSVTASHLGMFQQSGNFNIDSVEWACGLVLDPYLIAVPAESEIDSLSDMVETAKANPGSLSVAGFGERSGGQIAWLMLEDAGSLEEGDINWIPYSSVGDAVVAALGGHTDIVISYTGLVRQYVEAGELKVIGVMSDDRADVLPDVETYAEQGLDVDTTWQQFRGVIMPVGTPPEIQEAFCRAVDEVMKTEEMQQYIADSELIANVMRPEEFRSFVVTQNEATIEWAERLGQAD
ncbi:Bug family tripartite tricarboxylate transporter substrate binding protein [Georhizobium sp. MAB10]|uniref:Bug family tripartite tricarboxylate transporter substrate binding protein n=1 Tax=Georhizobium sp. MAB10 TaxID=3028319 RepID=UPI003855A135